MGKPEDMVLTVYIGLAAFLTARPLPEGFLIRMKIEFIVIGHIVTISFLSDAKKIDPMTLQ